MVSNEQARVIVATHKKYRMPKDTLYLPIQVGATGSVSIGYQRDDEGENISSLNPFFCELTGVYWAWKNLDYNYIGLVHYRRHFSLHPFLKNKWEAILKYEDIRSDLGRIKVFVPRKRRYYIETLYSHYKHTHHIYQLDETKRIIDDKYPEYIYSFNKAVNRTWGYMFNMMIMERGLFNDYCTWLFDILFELRERLGEEGLTPFHSRYYGRISEIIFNVWLTEQEYKGRIEKKEIKEIPFIQMDRVDWKRKTTDFLKAKFIGIKYSKSF